jgi:hypothetical protein
MGFLRWIAQEPRLRLPWPTDVRLGVLSMWPLPVKDFLVAIQRGARGTGVVYRQTHWRQADNKSYLTQGQLALK